MYWIFCNLRFLLLASAMKSVTANNQCRTEVIMEAMALKCSVFKRWSVAAPHLCDVKCGQEITCQSYNYNRKYQICELNNRTKEAKPENFLSAPGWFYIQRLNGRAPLGSIPELPALSCHEAKASEGKNTISGKYWLDPTGTGKAVLIYCDMVNMDMDECKDNITECDGNANCTNTYGSYKCTCRAGYTGNGHSCSDIDECSDGSHLCDVNANCANTNGSHNCTCKKGYIGDGRSCQDINECSEGSHVCDDNANCTNTKGSHNCICKGGFTGNGQSCQDIDECKGNHTCHVNANCTNTNGSHVCTCHSGYTGNGISCAVDPCYHYTSLSDANRKYSHVTPNFPVLCDDQLPQRWYRFVGAAGTKMPTTRVPAYRCGTHWSGWLEDAHPTVEDGEVTGKVCFSDRLAGCKYSKTISLKNCGSYLIYDLKMTPGCNSRYCGTN